MRQLIHLPPELRNKTIQRPEEIKPGLWCHAYGIGGGPPTMPVLLEVCAIGHMHRDGYSSFITNIDCFVAGVPGEHGSVDQFGSYYYADWNIGRHTSNWYFSIKKADAEEVYNYLLFFSRVIDT